MSGSACEGIVSGTALRETASPGTTGCGAKGLGPQLHRIKVPQSLQQPMLITGTTSYLVLSEGEKFHGATRDGYRCARRNLPFSLDRLSPGKIALTSFLRNRATSPYPEQGNAKSTMGIGDSANSRASTFNTGPPS